MPKVPAIMMPVGMVGLCPDCQMPFAGCKCPCSGCGRGISVCVCQASSNPYADVAQQQQNQWKKYQGTLPKGTTLSMDITQLQSLAQQLREIAAKSNQEIYEKEANDLYHAFVGRCKIAAHSGSFKTSFFKSNFQTYKSESFNMAANLLEKDGFVVAIVKNVGYEESDTELTVSWE